MKKYFVILLYSANCLLVSLFLNSCHKPVTSQKDTAEGLPIPPIATPPPEGMVLIPEGTFQIGSTDVFDYDEQPIRTVYVDTFYMDETEVTNAEYKAFLLENPRWQKGRIEARFHNGNYLAHWNGNNYPIGTDDHPVIWVSWYAAMTYAKWAGKRLPTEAEWERAGRGGLVGKKYPQGDTITTLDANYYNGTFKGTTPVGSYPANAYGLYDMAGNVSEWCLDEYDWDFYDTFPRNWFARNPLSVANSLTRLIRKLVHIEGSRVLRGGSWADFARYVRVSNRDNSSPRTTFCDFGFRCVRDVPP